MQRTKGQAGEREAAALICDLTGWHVRRRVRQHDGDSDLEGVPGWSVEIKRHAAATRSDIARWWAQAVSQADRTGAVPVLLYRLDRDKWRAVWPVSMHLVKQDAAMWTAYAWTVEGSPEAWAAVARETVANVTSGAVLRQTPHHRLTEAGAVDGPAIRSATCTPETISHPTKEHATWQASQ
jgi:hypothetical protein